MQCHQYRRDRKPFLNAFKQYVRFDKWFSGRGDIKGCVIRIFYRFNQSSVNTQCHSTKIGTIERPFQTPSGDMCALEIDPVVSEIQKGV
jgi:hypothetical protein